MEQFDLSTIGGHQFTVSVQDSGEVITVKVIKAELIHEIIKAHTLLLEMPQVNASELLELFTGFINSPFELSWYTTTDRTRAAYEKAVQVAMQDGNKIVVLEIVNPLTDKGPPRLRHQTDK